MARRLLTALLLALGLAVVVASLALAYLYRADFNITESGGTTYPMLAVIGGANNAWMANNGFIGNGQDTRVETLAGSLKPRMVADDKILTAIPVAAHSQTNLVYSTGNSNQAMSIIVGHGGSVSTTSHANIQPLNDFDLYYTDAFVDTSAGMVGETIARKDGALSWYVSSTGHMTLSIYGTHTSTQNTHTNSVNVGGSVAYQRVGDRWDNFPAGAVVTSAQFYLEQVLNPVGTAYARVRKVSDDSVIGTLGSVDVATGIPGAYAYVTFNTTPVTNSALQDVRISFEYDGGDVNNYVHAAYSTATAGPSGEYITLYNGAWADTAGRSTRHIIDYTTVDATVACACTAVEHDFHVYADPITAKLGIIIDGGAPAEGGLGAASGTSASDWVWMSTAVPYVGEIRFYQGANYRIDYHPQAIVLGTALPNVQVPGSYSGLIAWGSNPVGTVDAVLDSMTSSGQPAVGATAAPTPRDIVPKVKVSDWYGDGTVSGSALVSPLRPFVRLMSDTTSLTELQAWRFLGFAFWLLVTAATAKAVRGHQGITAMTSSVALLVLVAFNHDIYPLFLMVVAVPGFIGGLVAERSPWL